MNQSTTNAYFKIAVVTLVSVILGIIVGVINPTFPENPVRFLLSELVTAAIILLTTGIYLLFNNDKQNRNCQSYRKTVLYLGFLIFAAIGGFIISVIGLSTTITASLLSSVIIGIATGFFALILGAALLVLGSLIKEM